MSTMDDKDLRKNTPVTEEDLDIFGRSKSREEIKAEAKAQKARELAALREAHRQAKEKRKAKFKENRPDLIVLAIISLAVIVVAGVLIGISISKESKKLAKELAYERNEDSAGYFYDDEATPDMKDDGITAAVNQVYYTKGGYLCVYMTLGNGTDKAMRLDTLEVKISNGDTKDLIASGYTAEVDDSYIVPSGGTNTYTFYIKPEHVKITDDTLELITYEITAVGTEMED